jgi:hypothetical protein
MSTNDDVPPGATGADRVAAIARAIAGIVPGTGSAIAEVITELIPGQRQERLNDWLRRLAERLAAVEQAMLRERLREPENIALFEDGAYQAARVISEERRQQIAELVAGGIADDRPDYLESRRVLRLLGELDDAEVILLAAHLGKNQRSDYRERHANVIRGPAVDLGSRRDKLDQAAVREAGQQHLLQLGLLEEKLRVRSDERRDLKDCATRSLSSLPRSDGCSSGGSASQVRTTCNAKSAPQSGRSTARGRADHLPRPHCWMIAASPKTKIAVTISATMA